MTFRGQVDVLVHFESFRNVDLYHQGIYFLKSTLYHKKDGKVSCKQIVQLSVLTVPLSFHSTPLASLWHYSTRGRWARHRTPKLKQTRSQPTAPCWTKTCVVVVATPRRTTNRCLATITQLQATQVVANSLAPSQIASSRTITTSLRPSSIRTSSALIHGPSWSDIKKKRSN